MSLAALTTDIMLPALSQIGLSLEVEKANDTQLIISLIFIGLAVGQLISGPLADSFGRKLVMSIGLVIFLFGVVLSIFTDNFELMIVGRLLQGIGLSAPRIVCIAIIRDKHVGPHMAKMMSNIMSVFIFIPMVAPMLGQLVLSIADWRAIFGVVFILGLISLVWFLIRQPETLAIEQRHPFSFIHVGKMFKVVASNRIVVTYSLAAGFMFAGFVTYLSASPQIFQQQYGLDESFVFVFSGIALSLGLASFINAKLVIKFGMHKICHVALFTIVIVSIIFALFCWFIDAIPPLWLVISFLCVVMFSKGMLIGNLNAIAMEPLGKSAGMGASFVGFMSTLLSVPIGIFFARMVTNDIWPIVTGEMLNAISALLLIYSIRKISAKTNAIETMNNAHQ